ncbi:MULTISPECIES: hypothetical protein [Streptomyces]|uniref:Uncharacterized protein n=1 Tax=Streptomyces luteosporeus TaxID=173856 RepID=A0ABP6GMR7_9ACTN
MAWLFAVSITVLTVSVVVDWVRGEGLDWAVAALLLMLWPYAVDDLLRTHGRQRAAGRARTVSHWMVLPAGAVLWAGLIVGWSRGEGTPWFPFAAAVLIPLGAAATARAAVLRRRRAASAS